VAVAKRNSSPALYEMISSRLKHQYQASAQQPGTPPDAAAPDQSAAEQRSAYSQSTPRPPSQRFAWLAPGRIVRLPVGHVLIAGALILLLLLASYLIGYGRAPKVKEADSDAALRQQAEAVRTHGPGFDQLSKPSPSPPSVEARPNPVLAMSPPVLGAQEASYGEMESDPRQKDLNYFVLAETTREGALRLAEFCRANALEAYVVKRNNKARLQQVIVLPGYASSDRGTPVIKALEARIKEVGRRWSSEPGSGKDDLGRYYPDKFNG
jgi:hypothetical protein